MALIPQEKVLTGFRFRVGLGGLSFGGSTTAGFSKVSGIELEVEITDYREGTDPSTPRKIPGLTKYGNVTLEKGLSPDGTLADWIASASNGNPERTNVSIETVDANGETLRGWELSNAVPAKWSIGDLDATSSDVVIESLEIAHEGIINKF